MPSFEYNPSNVIEPTAEGVQRRRYDNIYMDNVKTGDSFNGEISFTFQTGTNEAVEWGNSYFEFDISCWDVSQNKLQPFSQVRSSSGWPLSGQLNTPAVYPNFNAIGAMFSNFTLINNSVPVTTQTEFRVADTYAKRVSYSAENRKTWGRSAFLESSDISRTMYSGYADTSGRTTIETPWDTNIVAAGSDARYKTAFCGKQTCTQVWAPSVSYFGNDVTTMGAQSFNLRFTIDPNYKRNAVTVSGAADVPPAASATSYTSWNWLVNNVIFHPCVVTMDGKEPYTGKHYERISSWNATSVTLNGTNPNLTFFVPSSSYRLAVFEQSNDYQSNSNYSSTKFTASGLELAISRAPRITYAGQTFPLIDVPVTNDDKVLTGLQQIYMWYCLANGFTSENPAANEDFLTWLQLGYITSSRFDRSLSEAGSTQVQVALVHSSTDKTPSNTNVYCVAVADKMIEYTYSNGQVVSVNVQDI